MKYNCETRNIINCGSFTKYRELFHGSKHLDLIFARFSIVIPTRIFINILMRLQSRKCRPCNGTCPFPINRILVQKRPIGNAQKHCENHTSGPKLKCNFKIISRVTGSESDNLI